MQRETSQVVRICLKTLDTIEETASGQDMHTVTHFFLHCDVKIEQSDCIYHSVAKNLIINFT